MYKVLTAFQFDVSAALLGANTLQKSTEKLASTADTALSSYKRLGLGIGAAFGVGPMGLLTVLYKSVSAAEEFNNAQEAMAMLIRQNADQFEGSMKDYNKNLKISRQLMIDIAKAGEQFGLPEKETIAFAKLLMPMMLSKGIAHDFPTKKDRATKTAAEIAKMEAEAPFRNIIDVSRGLLKSAPILGVDPGFVENQLLEIIEGRAGANNRLFIRLAMETKAFQAIAQKGGQSLAKAFNLKPIEERVKILKDGLLEFGNDQDFLNAQAKTLRYQLQSLQNVLFGITGIFRETGEIVRNTFVNLLQQLNNLLNNQGRRIVSSLNKFFEGALKSPEQTYMNLRTVSKAPDVIAFAGLVSKIILGVELLVFLITSIKPAKSQLNKMNSDFKEIKGSLKSGGLFGGFFSFFEILDRSIKKIKTPKVAGSIFISMIKFFGDLMSFLLKRVFPIVGALGLFSALLQRGKAMAEVQNLKAAPEQITKLIEESSKLKNTIEILTRPLRQTFDAIAGVFAFFYNMKWLAEQATKALGGLNNALIFGAKIINIVEALFAAVFTALISYSDQVAKMFRGHGLLSYSKIIEDVNKAIEDVNQRYRELFATQNGDKALPVAAVNQTNYLNVYQDFKEKQDPDRIAFTLQQVLMGVAQNPRQSSLRSFQGSTLGSGVQMMP